MNIVNRFKANTFTFLRDFFFAIDFSDPAGNVSDVAVDLNFVLDMARA